MSLVDVPVPPSPAALPRAVAQLLAEVPGRLETLLAGRTLPGFVPSDFRQVYGTLRAIVEEGLAPGDCFLEWGSGLGVAAVLAAQLELDAHGIEIDPELVEASRELADEYGLEARFACGTYVPRGGEDLADRVTEFDWLLAGGPCGYDALQLAPEELDVVFAYPWPGEEHVVEALFDRYAPTGALLVTYRGVEEMRVQRKAPVV